MAPAPPRIFTRVNSQARRLLIDAFPLNIGRIGAVHTRITGIQFGIFAISRKFREIAQVRAVSRQCHKINWHNALRASCQDREPRRWGLLTRGSRPMRGASSARTVAVSRAAGTACESPARRPDPGRRVSRPEIGTHDVSIRVSRFRTDPVNRRGTPWPYRTGRSGH
jgi:hypothetical protein